MVINTQNIEKKKEIEKKHESDRTAAEKRYLEKVKIRELHGKAKVEYLWSYYRYLIAVLFFAVIVITGIGTGIANNGQHTVLSVAVVDACRQDEATINTLEKKLLKIIGSEEKHAEVIIDASLSSSEQSAQLIKTAIGMSSEVGENDIVICDRKTYEKFQAQGAFESWKDILGEHYAIYEPYVVGDALDISESEVWKNTGITSYEEVYCCVLQDTEHTENIKKVVKYFL